MYFSKIKITLQAKQRAYLNIDIFVLFFKAGLKILKWFSEDFKIWCEQICSTELSLKNIHYVFELLGKEKKWKENSCRFVEYHFSLIVWNQVYVKPIWIKKPTKQEVIVRCHCSFWRLFSWKLAHLGQQSNWKWGLKPTRVSKNYSNIVKLIERTDTISHVCELLGGWLQPLPITLETSQPLSKQHLLVFLLSAYFQLPVIIATWHPVWNNNWLE